MRRGVSAVVASLLIAAGVVPAQSQPYSPQRQRDLLQESLRRHAFATTYGIPAAYAARRNPLPEVAKTWRRGAIVYARRCATCHGPAGRGDGPSGELLPTPPANLAWFATLPMSRWDGFMYWSIAEGGYAFGTAMPAFRTVLSSRDIWAVTAYIRHTLGTTRPS